MTKPYKIFPGKKRPDYVQIYKDNRGTIRSYVRRGGVKIGTMKAEPFTERWRQEYYAIMAGQPLPANEDEENAPQPGRVIPGSWEDAIRKDKASLQDRGKHLAWYGLKPRSQENIDKFYPKIIEFMGQRKIATTPQDVLKDWVAKKAKDAPGSARNLCSALRRLTSLAVELGWCQHDLMHGVARPKLRKRAGGKSGYTTITPEGLAHYMEVHAGNSDAIWALAARAWGCGARSGDFRQLGWKNISTDEYGQRWLKFTPTKTDTSTGVAVKLPIDDYRFVDALATRDPNAPFFLTGRGGKPWPAQRLQRAFRGWATEAGLPVDDKMHGLRKSFACWLLSKGVSIEGIAAALGDTVDSVRVYIQDFNRDQAAANAIRQAATRKAA
jgi:integrase